MFEFLTLLIFLYVYFKNISPDDIDFTNLKETASG